MHQTLKQLFEAHAAHYPVIAQFYQCDVKDLLLYREIREDLSN